MSALLAQAYESQTLIPEKHARLIQNIESFASVAGIPVSKICESASPYLNSKDLKVALKIRKWIAEGYAGSVMRQAPGGKSIELRMQSMTGLFMRNFIDARMMVLTDVLSDMDTAFDAKVLMIPNFLIANKSGRGLPAWQISDLHGLLVSRHSNSKFTILYCKNSAAVAAEYGQSMADHIRENYLDAKN